MASFTAGGQDVVCFATTRGKLCGLDLRSNRMVWELTNEAKYGTCTMHGTCSSNKAKPNMDAWGFNTFTCKLLC